MADFKYRNLTIDVDQLEDAQKAGITGEAYIVDEQTVKLEICPDKLYKLLPTIRFMDIFQKMNKDKKK